MRKSVLSTVAILATVGVAGCTPTSGGPEYVYLPPNQMIPADVVERAFQAGVGPDAVVIQTIPGSDGFCWFYEVPSGGYASLGKCVG